MAISRKDRIRSQRRARRVSEKLKQVSSLPRVSVFRSLKHIYAQLINDAESRTIASFSSLVCDETTGDKKAIAHKIGIELAKKARELGIEKVVFDRGRFLYHGRVKALAEGLREGGLQV